METTSGAEAVVERTQIGEQRAPRDGAAPDRNFRFYDSRQKYLLFVNTCAEKSAVADRVAQELPAIHPSPPAVRVFDAGVGDGTVPDRGCAPRQAPRQPQVSRRDARRAKEARRAVVLG